ncbi:ArnT family glycosyltransferase [Paucidesulfovibrio longus]|uniref:ArnT family glycosyltransferase n=1 Tax=Paucidesulfovibrio longus TaxID=889 RepID=UPI0003B5C331|nr:phospholipid carrier-dependent glycosyltransferase [Paucidesulfovibrio longus]
MPHTLWDRIWDRLSAHPWLTMSAAVFLQSAFLLNSRALWFSDEVRYANAYENMHRAGTWVVLSLNGMPYPDKPPVYFWFLALLDKITPLDPPSVFFLGAALSGLGFLFAAYALARAVRLKRDASLATALICASCLFFAAILHYSRMDLMFAALTVAAEACLFRGYADPDSRRDVRWILGGFSLCGLAVLVKGPLGVLFPLLTVLVYLGWRGEMRRFLSLRTLAGLGCFAAVSSAWVLAAYLVEGGDFVRTVFVQQIFQRATNTFHHKEGPLYYFIVLPATWLPWTLTLAAAPVALLLRRSFWREVRAERKADSTLVRGRTWLWISALSAFALLSCLSGKVVIYVLPLFAPMAALTAHSLLGWNAARRNRLAAAFAVFFTLLGVALFFGDALIPFPAEITGLAPTALTLLATAGALLLVRRMSARTLLLCLLLGVTLWIQVAARATVPSLDSVMSPKEQGERLGFFIKKGYTPVAYDIYSGIFTYYAGENIIEIPKHLEEVEKLLTEHPKVALVMKKKHWERWTDRPASLHVVHEQFIADQPYVLAIQGPAADIAPFAEQQP